jgi:hypothetical protein
MKLFEIKNIASGQITHFYQAVEEMPHQEGWGTLASDETQWDADGNPTIIHHDATYTVVITDLSDQLRLADIQAYCAQRSTQCEAAVTALLAPAQDVTHLMLAVYDIYVALDLAGGQTQAEIDAAKLRLDGMVTLMGQIQALRSARDADIAAYTAAHGV